MVAATIGLPMMGLSTSEAEGSVEVCVEVSSGDLGRDVAVTYMIMDVTTSESSIIQYSCITMKYVYLQMVWIILSSIWVSLYQNPYKDSVWILTLQEMMYWKEMRCLEYR